MKVTQISCDRCGREVKDHPDRGNLYCYRGGAENKTDRIVDLCEVCYGHFLTMFLSAMAGRMGVKPPSSMSFDEAWQRKIDEGYQYGQDALEQVRFGWELSRESLGLK